jgi:hypothetical protein
MATTTNLGITKLDNSTNQPEVLVNAGFDILDAMAGGNGAILFQRRNSTTTGLTWGYHGGTMLVDGVLTTINAGTVALTGSVTNYVETTRSGTVSKNTSAFTAGQIPLYEVVTSASAITSYTDRRVWNQPEFVQGRLVRSFASDADITLTAAEARNQILEFTSGVSLTATRNVTVPLAAQQWTVYNNTTGGQSILIKGASGTGITLQNKQRLLIYADGTNIVPQKGLGHVQLLAYAASITVNAQDGDRVIIGALTGGLTLNAPTNGYRGQTLTFYFLQDGTGGRTITWNAAFRKAADGAGAANQKGITMFLYDGTEWVQFGGALAFA